MSKPIPPEASDGIAATESTSSSSPPLSGTTTVAPESPDPALSANSPLATGSTFGSAAPATGSIFGSAPTATTSSGFTFGGGGGNAAFTSILGATQNNNDEAAGGGLFSQPAASTSAGLGTFGAKPATVSLCDSSLEDPLYDGTNTSEARISLKAAKILPQIFPKTNFSFQVVRDVLSKYDGDTTPKRESFFVARIIEAVEKESGDAEANGVKNAVEMLEKDLPAESKFLVDHFWIIKEIFATQKPETIAVHMVRLANDYEYVEKRRTKDDYVNLIIEKLMEASASRDDATSVAPETALSTSLPSHWEPMEGGYALVEVAEGSSEFHAVVSNWNIPSPVVKIERIQNRRLWCQFEIHRSLVLEKVGEAVLNERNLWHGTNATAAKSISFQGFDFRVGVKNARVWGNGIYLSIYPDFALHYSNPDQGSQMKDFLRSQYDMQNIQPPQHLQMDGASVSSGPKRKRRRQDLSLAPGCMIYTRTICGRSTVGDERLTRPPFIDPKDEMQGLYDSCTNNTKDIYIIFENAQVYPEYIIYFTGTDPFQEYTMN